MAPRAKNIQAAATLPVINQRIIDCQRCPELRQYLAEIGRTKRRSYAESDYWARPVPSFGDVKARILIVGLAPGAHGANRTGRMFTGDRSGDFLYAALHRVGLANQPDATHAEDGLRLSGVYIAAAQHCAPPANKPTAAQLAACNGFLVQELQVLKPRVVLCLGGIAWKAALTALRACDVPLPRPLPKFSHGSECDLGPITLLGSYHVSQQNTFTGRLTETMLDRVLLRAVAVAK